MSDGFSKRTIEYAIARAGGACEWCGKHLPLQAHHRLFRSRSGGHGVENAAMLCGSGNMTGCHGKAHQGNGHSLGFALPSGSNPALVWVLSSRWGWCLFQPDGGVALPAHVALCVAHEESRDPVASVVGCEACVLVTMTVTGEEVRRSWT